MTDEDSQSVEAQENAALDGLTVQDPPRASTPPLLPWLLSGIAVLVLLFSVLYAHKSVAEADAKVAAAESSRQSMQDALAKGEKDGQKDRARVVELTGKSEELSAQNAELTSHLKDKDAQLVHLQQAQDAMVQKLTALAKSAHGRGIPSAKVMAALPKAAPGSTNAKLASGKKPRR